MERQVRSTRYVDGQYIDVDTNVPWEGEEIPVGWVGSLLIVDAKDAKGKAVGDLYARALESLDAEVCDARWFILCPLRVEATWELGHDVAIDLANGFGCPVHFGTVDNYAFAIVTNS